MQSEIKKIIIVGGGSAGWLTAGLIAAKHIRNSAANTLTNSVSITVIESPNIPTIGVGEGTWPSMRETLKTIGINEADLFTQCDASFKQASKFVHWENAPDTCDINHYAATAYFHPFSLPSGTTKLDLSSYIGEQYSNNSQAQTFAQHVCFQSVLCEQNLAPKQITHKAYDYVANYGYHLNATKFAQLLKDHCLNKLGVEYLSSHITQINNDAEGDIASVTTDSVGIVAGDLFIDCSGAQSLLLGKHYQIPFCSKKSVLFNDSALAVQIPYDDDDAVIASSTVSTAQTAGWIWDIGLQSRRGVGHVYSSQHITDEKAEEELIEYIKSSTSAKQRQSLSIRKLSFEPGYYEKFWHRNCVAVGMSAGFIEPLEASALAMIEQAAKMISEQLPANKQTMKITAKRFNEKFSQHWQQIIEFLKLHYVLSKREDSSYWLANKESSSIPQSLQEMLELWQFQTPSAYDITQSTPLFPAASYQYVLYGMNFKTQPIRTANRDTKAIQRLLLDVQNKRQHLAKAMGSNRELINKIKQFGLSQI